MVFIDAECSGYTIKILRFLDRLLYRFSVQASGTAYSIGRKFCQVITKRIESIRFLVVLRLEIFDELGNLGVLVQRRIMVGIIHVVQRCSACKLEEFRRIK